MCNLRICNKLNWIVKCLWYWHLYLSLFVTCTFLPIQYFLSSWNSLTFSELFVSHKKMKFRSIDDHCVVIHYATSAANLKLIKNYWHFQETKLQSKQQQQKQQGVNFIIILLARFLYESGSRSFSLVHFGFVFFGERISAKKVRVKRWWNWPLLLVI